MSFPLQRSTILPIFLSACVYIAYACYIAFKVFTLVFKSDTINSTGGAKQQPRSKNGGNDMDLDFLVNCTILIVFVFLEAPRIFKKYKRPILKAVDNIRKRVNLLADRIQSALDDDAIENEEDISNIFAVGGLA